MTCGVHLSDQIFAVEEEDGEAVGFPLVLKGFYLFRGLVNHQI